MARRLRRMLGRLSGALPVSLTASLTTRLALAYGLTTAAILVGVAAYLSSALDSQLQARDESELVGEILLVRHLLREVGDEAEIRADTHRFADIAMGHEGLILVVRTRQGEPLITLNPRNESVPPLRVLPATAAPDKGMLRPGIRATACRRAAWRRWAWWATPTAPWRSSCSATPATGWR